MTDINIMMNNSEDSDSTKVQTSSDVVAEMSDSKNTTAQPRKTLPNVSFSNCENWEVVEVIDMNLNFFREALESSQRYAARQRNERNVARRSATLTWRNTAMRNTAMWNTARRNITMRSASRRNASRR